MTEIPITARIPPELEKELERYMKTEHLERSGAIRKLLYMSLQDWKEKYSLELLSEGKVTLLKAAEISGMDMWSFLEKVKKAKIHWVSDKIIETDLEAFK